MAQNVDPVYTQTQFVYVRSGNSSLFDTDKNGWFKTEGNSISAGRMEYSTKETKPSVPPSENWINSGHVGNTPLPAQLTFTNEYVLFNMTNLAKKIEKEFEWWIDKGTDNSMLHIAKIRDLIKEFKPYVRQDDDARIVVSLLSLLFDNNIWDGIPKTKLLHIKNIISRFTKHNVNKKEVLAFIKDLSSSNFSILAHS